MKRILVGVLVLLVSIPGLSGFAAGRPATRQEVVPYVGSAVSNGTGGFNCAGHDRMAGYPGVGCVVMRPMGNDRAVSASVDDAAGLDVAAWLVQSHWDPDREVYTWSQITRFCTRTDKPITLAPQTNIVFVALWQRACIDGTTSVATAGEVTFTIHQR